MYGISSQLVFLVWGGTYIQEGEEEDEEEEE